jgi:hypothetical protein
MKSVLKFNLIWSKYIFWRMKGYKKMFSVKFTGLCVYNKMECRSWVYNECLIFNTNNEQNLQFLPAGSTKTIVWYPVILRAEGFSYQIIISVRTFLLNKSSSHDIIKVTITTPFPTGHRGHDHMIVVTTFAINAYHH